MQRPPNNQSVVNQSGNRRQTHGLIDSREIAASSRSAFIWIDRENAIHMSQTL